MDVRRTGVNGGRLASPWSVERAAGSLDGSWQKCHYIYCQNRRGTDRDPGCLGSQRFEDRTVGTAGFKSPKVPMANRHTECASFSAFIKVEWALHGVLGILRAWD